MTNDATRASAQSMPDMNRRTALAVTGSALAASLAGIARQSQAASADASLAELERLIAEHTQAVAADREIWNYSADIIEKIEGKLPHCRVQVGRLLGLRDDNGNETWTPIYAHSDEDIEKRHEAHLDAMLSMWGRNDEAAARIREKHDQRVSQKKAELAAVRAERKHIEDESGYTAAMEAARASSAAVRAIEAQIVALVPGTFDAAARKAAWIVHAYNEDEGAYLYDEGDDALIAALKTIAEARI